MMPYDEGLEIGVTEDDVKVEDLINNGEVTFSGDNLIKKFNWYLDNDLSTFTMVFPLPEELNTDSQGI